MFFSSTSHTTRQANTDVMVGVKGEISEPDQKKPKHGKLNFYVDWLTYYPMLYNAFINN